MVKKKHRIKIRCKIYREYTIASGFMCRGKNKFYFIIHKFIPKYINIYIYLNIKVNTEIEIGILLAVNLFFFFFYCIHIFSSL